MGRGVFGGLQGNTWLPAGIRRMRVCASGAQAQTCSRTLGNRLTQAKRRQSPDLLLHPTRYVSQAANSHQPEALDRRRPSTHTGRGAPTAHEPARPSPTPTAPGGSGIQLTQAPDRKADRLPAPQQARIARDLGVPAQSQPIPQGPTAPHHSLQGSQGPPQGPKKKKDRGCCWENLGARDRRLVDVTGREWAAA